MKKLTLDIETLAVETFDTYVDHGQRGTVNGQEDATRNWFTCMGPGCYTNYGTCGESNSIDYNTCLAGCDVTEGIMNSCAVLLPGGCG